MSNNNYLLTTKQVCDRYKITPTTLFRKMNQYQFPRPTFPGRPHQWLKLVLDHFDEQCVEQSLQRLDEKAE